MPFKYNLLIAIKLMGELILKKKHSTNINVSLVLKLL